MKLVTKAFLAAGRHQNLWPECPHRGAANGGGCRVNVADGDKLREQPRNHSRPRNEYTRQPVDHCFLFSFTKFGSRTRIFPDIAGWNSRASFIAKMSVLATRRNESGSAQATCVFFRAGARGTRASRRVSACHCSQSPTEPTQQAIEATSTRIHKS
jgi:hypothetical protein